MTTDRIDPADVYTYALGDAYSWQGPDKKIPAPFLWAACWVQEDFEVTIGYELEPGKRPAVTSVEMYPRDTMHGPYLTTEMVRSVPLASLLKVSLAQAFPGDRYAEWRKNQPARKDGRKLADDFVKHLAALVSYAEALGDDKAEVVADVYGIPVATAQRYATTYAERANR